MRTLSPPARYIIAAFLVAPLLAGCAELARKPVRDLPEERLDFAASWRAGEESNHGEVSEAWLETFEDPALKFLVSEALHNNPDLLATASRLAASREQLIIARAARLPSVSASTSASGGGSKTRGSDGVLSPWRHSEDYSLSLNVSWELDVWGRLRNVHQAAIEDYTATAADYRAAQLSLAANTARSWFNVISATRQLDLAEKTRDLFQRNYQITERNYKAGDSTASPLDVQFGRNNVASAERSVISRELALTEAKRTLELLLGRYPDAMIPGRADFPEMSESVPTGLPSDLLMRRPDLIASAADLRASAERAQASKKDMLPSINLTGRGSLASDKLTDLIANPASIAWSVAASISQPVFRGGSLKARARQSMAFNDAAVQNFAGVALRAFREVESSLAREHSLAAQQEFLETELTQADLAEDQASRDYSEGIVGILAVLEAQRRAFGARSAMISLRNGRLQNRVDLLLALGGSFGPLDDDSETGGDNEGLAAFAPQRSNLNDDALVMED